MILIVRVRVTHFNLHQHTFLGTQNLVVNVMKASNHSIRVFDIKLDFDKEITVSRNHHSFSEHWPMVAFFNLI
jgi:hypothetical protein